MALLMEWGNGRKFLKISVYHPALLVGGMSQPHLCSYNINTYIRTYTIFYVCLFFVLVNSEPREAYTFGAGMLLHSDFGTVYI